MQSMPGRADLVELDATILAIKERLSSLSNERYSIAERMERMNQNLRQIKNVKSLCCYQCRSQLSLSNFSAGSRLSVQSGSSLASSVSCCSENGFGLDECDDASSLSDSSSISSNFSSAQVCYRHRKASYKPSALQLEVLPQYAKDRQCDLTKIPEVSLGQGPMSTESSTTEIELLTTNSSSCNFIPPVTYRRRSLQAARSDSCLVGQATLSRRPFSIRLSFRGWKGSTESVYSTTSCIRGLETAV